MNKFTFLKAFFCPFRRPAIRLYIGKIIIGTPYFLPRRWVKSKEKPGYLTAIPRKIGFDFVQLGWKTKWSSDDYRFEWAPIWSFVFFKWQIAMIFIAPYQDHYWESWLYYTYDTDGKKSKRERILDCRKNYPNTWTTHNNGNEETIDYYTKILKSKYLSNT